MFCVSALFPKEEGGTFNFDYYVERHIPMVAGFVGGNGIRVEVRKGLTSADGSSPPFVCQANFWIRSIPEFQAALASNASQIGADLPNFTNLHPVLQFDEVITSANKGPSA